MFLDTNQIKLNNIDIGMYLLNATYQYPKLWGDDTGRNLEGEFAGTFKGVYPKLTLTFGKLSREIIETLAPIFDSASQTITYYDPVLRRNLTINTYTGDWSLDNRKKNINESFDISFISKVRRPNS